MTAKEKLEQLGYENIVVFENYSYDTALIGVSNDNRAVYSYDKMVEFLMTAENMEETDAIEWIDYNTLRALPYGGQSGPIVVYDIESLED